MKDKLMEKRIWCPFADDKNFNCKYIGVEDSCTDGKLPCIKLDEAEGVDRDRPWDSQDPWSFPHEVTSTYMNF
jgi:hypothetical protein